MNEEFSSIFVRRVGKTPSSHMVTESVIGVICPDQDYQVGPEQLVTVSGDSGNGSTKFICATVPRPSSAKAESPPHAVLSGRWNNSHLRDNPANILGKIGYFQAGCDNLRIPQAATNSETLGFYGARLLRHGDILRFQAKERLPVTMMEVGERYIPDYIYPIGGGVYLEHHDFPHFHMPVNSDCRGHLILGKYQDGNIILSAFKIPYGYAIYTPPQVIHNDVFLIGRYIVVYALTKEYSTVILKDREGRCLPVDVTVHGIKRSL